MKRSVAIAIPALLLTLLTFLPNSASGQFSVVAGGLQGPRGLAFGPGGKLYVTQTGTGDNGKITEIQNPLSASPSTRDLVTGLVAAGEEGEMVGPAGISALGNGDIYAIMGLANEKIGASGLLLGHLLKVSQAGQALDVVDVGDFDYDWANGHFDLAPHDFPDANPYGVLALPGHIYVVDAATNTLNQIRPDGSIEILAYFPNNVIADATPTCVAQGPDGALYIGTLALRDSLAFGHKAIVYRVDPSQADPSDMSKVLSVATPWATGLWPINGCAFGPDGSFYASQLITTQHFSNGDVVKIPFATPDVHTSLTGGTLLFPAGVAVGPDGSVFVSNGAAIVPVGQVVRLTNR